MDNDKGTDLFKTDVNDISKAVSVNPASDDILNIIASDKALYYATLTEIYKADIDGKNETKICDDFNGVDHFILINDTIYYANNAGKIKSVSVSGENSKILYENTRYADVDKNIRIVDLVDDYIYFYVDGGLGKVNTDGSNATIFYEDKGISSLLSDCAVLDSQMYYTRVDGNYEDYTCSLCRVKLDGTDNKTYSNTENLSSYKVEGDKMFFICGQKIYSMRTDGSNLIELAKADSAKCFIEFIYDNKLYLSDFDGEKYQLWCLDKEGKNKKVIASFEDTDYAAVTLQGDYILIDGNDNNQIIGLK